VDNLGKNFSSAAVARPAAGRLKNVQEEIGVQLAHRIRGTACGQGGPNLRQASGGGAFKRLFGFYPVRL
jgi:hypothetical protein